MPYSSTLMLVEDNEAEARLFEMAFAKASLNLSMVHCFDGDAFLSELDGITPSSISMFVIDLNLPGLSGLDLVRYLRKEVQYRQTPILVFSNSQHPDDVRLSYEAGANVYVTKPMDLDDYDRIVRQFLHFMIRPSLEFVA